MTTWTPDGRRIDGGPVSYDNGITFVVGDSRNTDPDTSHDAGGITMSRSEHAKALLLIYLAYADGLTAVEAGQLTGLARPDRRVSDLFRLGYLRLVRDEYGAVVKRRPFNVQPRYGRDGRVLTLTDAGLDAAKSVLAEGDRA